MRAPIRTRSQVLLLLRDPTLEILGIAASFGCHGDVRRTAANARRLLDAAGAGAVPNFTVPWRCSFFVRSVKRACS